MSDTRRMREGNLARITAGEPFDLLVIGGGVTGAGVALEAARAGVSVVLVESADFASGTSSRSSKLVHGGLRYLKQGKFGLMREALHERAALLRDASGLVEPLQFILPVRKNERPGKFVYGLGLKFYDFLAGVHSRRWLDAEAVKKLNPAMHADGLIGAWAYLDAETDDARLVLRVLQEARAVGAVTINYCRVENFLRDDQGKVCGATLADLIGGKTFSIKAKCIINAAGVRSDALRRRVGGETKIRPLRGGHLLFPASKLPAEKALAFTHPDDRRAVFIIPWEGAVFVGTTDLDHNQDLAIEPSITRGEVDYLMRAVNSLFPSLNLKAGDALSSWAGVRPVISSGRSLKPSEETREHFITDENGLISICGGKLTTFRAMAHEVLARASIDLPQLKSLRPGKIFDAAPTSLRPVEWSDADYRRMIGRYGAQLSTLIDSAAPGELALIPDTRTPWAELRYACGHESVVHLDDLLLRRTRLGLLLPCGGEALLPEIENIVRQELGWRETRWRNEVERYQDIIRRSYSIPGAAP
ncbi:MAG: glycerol-3-phosphate dehydrogenase/oxidase [Parvularculaceae bacterium]